MLLVILIFTLVDAISQSVLPVPDHIVAVILENHSYSQIIGSSEAVYINALASDSNSALFINSYAIEHPSQPNYLDLYSGCNQGVTNNDVPLAIPFTTANLGRQLIDAGKTFVSYSEDLPSVGFNGASAGKYVRKHNPVSNWMGTGTNQVPITTNQPFSAFPSDNFTLLPDVCFVIPNQDNNMHDGSITMADNWIYNNLSSYIQWTKTNNSLFILTFDEDNYAANNHITTIFTGQMVTGGQYSDTINHYSILRTIEDMYELPYACNASEATTISACWTNPNSVNVSQITFSVYPNPASHFVKIEIPEIYSLGNLKLSFLNVHGEIVKEVSINSVISNIQVDELSSGLYLYHLQNERKVIKKGKIIINYR